MTARDAAMPAFFLGHGSPMNAVEDSAFRRGWSEVARRFPTPRAVLCISAHWETQGVWVTATERPETIYDFVGFPRRLYKVVYPAPGDPELARTVAEAVRITEVKLDSARGLDHGAWSVLGAMYPAADVPVVQLSLDSSRPGSFHVDLARELASLRQDGILVVGSGNLVHHLGRIEWDRPGGADWADRFDALVQDRIRAGDLAALMDYPALGPDAALAVPTPDHFLPLLYPLAMRRGEESVTFFNQATLMGSISMTSFAVGLEGGLDGGASSR